MTAAAMPLQRRIYRGIIEHFPARKSEWIVSLITILWGLILINPEPVFTTPAWSQMAKYASETVWGSAAISIGGFRLIALIINGTFPQNIYGRLSPVVRALASLASTILWAQITLGIWMSDSNTTGLAVYPGLLLLDFTNTLSAAQDAGKMRRARENDIHL